MSMKRLYFVYSRQHLRYLSLKPQKKQHFWLLAKQSWSQPVLNKCLATAREKISTFFSYLERKKKSPAASLWRLQLISNSVLLAETHRGWTNVLNAFPHKTFVKLIFGIFETLHHLHSGFLPLSVHRNASLHVTAINYVSRLVWHKQQDCVWCGARDPHKHPQCY